MNLLTIALSFLSGCSDDKHFETKVVTKSNGEKENLECTCTKIEESEPVVSESGTDTFATYQETFKCKCKQAIEYNSSPCSPRAICY